MKEELSKKDAAKKINELIKKNPSDEYLRFAILSFFENNSEDEIVQKLNKLSDFSRMQVFEKLKQMVKDKTFIDMDVRELIKKHYTIDIFEK